MHQPYYKNLLTEESHLPWVRLHGTKDYLDMLEVITNYPKIQATFNIVPSLIEQIEDYANETVKDTFLELSYKKAVDLTHLDKEFLLKNFFSINKDRVISLFPRYYELYFKKQKSLSFDTQDFLDLQTLFNLAWIDPIYRERYEPLKNAIKKARYFTEEEKRAVLDTQIAILKKILPAYKKAGEARQIEFSVTPYYHPILPLLATTNAAKEANLRSLLPKKEFKYPLDAKAHIESAVNFYKERLGYSPLGMWPSEEAVSEKILPYIIESGINWIVTDEAILFKSLNKNKRDTKFLYQPYTLKRKEGNLNIIFRDTSLSDLIGFVYHNWEAKAAATDFINHLENINKAFKGKDLLVVVAMDGENAWEYFANDGHYFLNELYSQLSDSKTIKTTTVSEYLKNTPPKLNIKHLSSGSWIYGNFDKWMNNDLKTQCWDWLLDARKKVEEVEKAKDIDEKTKKLILKQLHIAEGSDWFWWAGEDPDGSFDRLYKMHLNNLYKLLQKPLPEYLKG